MEEVPIIDRRSSELSEQLMVKAKEELGETDEKREECITQIKLWINSQINDYSVLDDRSILWFLRGCKFDLDRTHSRIHSFFSFRSKVPEWYSNRDPLLPEVSEILKIGTLLPLPGRDDEGRRVVLIRAALHNPYQHKQDDVFKVMNMIFEAMCTDDIDISVSGVVSIIDLKGVGMGHAMQMTPAFIRKAVSSWQDVNPVRSKSMHYINTPLNIHVIMNIFKTFMKEKLRRRLHLHRGDCKKILPTLIPCDILPKEYGGTGPSVNDLTVEWTDRITAKRDWFMNPDKHGPFSPF